MELAIALIVIAVLAGGAISALKAQVAHSRNSEVREQLREAREALLSFAVVNGALPCTTDQNAADTCGNQKGYLPSGKLGLRANDPWGQPLRYAVSSSLTTSSSFSFSTPGSLQIMQGTTNIDSGNAVAFVVWSTGEDAIDASASAANSAVISESPTSDDFVEWTSRYVLFGRMLTAGRNLSFGSYSSSAAASSASSAASSASSS